MSNNVNVHKIWQEDKLTGRIEITTKIGCSVMCEYCPQTLLIGKYKERVKSKKDWVMSFDNFKFYISSIPSSIELHFTGMVEPFKNPECVDMILYADKKGHEIMVNTTLEGFTEELYNSINHIKFKSFNIHLPSATYKENIGVKKSPEYIESGQKKIRKEWLNLLLYIYQNPPFNFTVHSHGGLHPEVKTLFEQLPDKLNNMTGNRAGNIVVDGGENQLQSTKVPDEKNMRGKCPRIFQPVLLPNGELSICCQDYGLKEIFGDLSKQTWKQYRNSIDFKKLIINGADLCDYCYYPGDDDGNFYMDIKKERERV